MTTIKILKKNDNILEIEVEGHSCYGKKGSDILCASVSTLVQTTALGLTQLISKDFKLTKDVTIPSFKIIVPKNLSQEDNKLAQAILKTCEIGLVDLASGYAKNLKVEVNE